MAGFAGALRKRGETACATQVRPAAETAEMRVCVLFTILTMAAGLGACGGGGGSDVVVPPAPPPPPAPSASASFTSPATAGANVPVAFDASASAASDGSALQYFWEFGDGRRGGGRRIAHVYPTGGDRNVTLTVRDGAGRSATQTRTVAVTAPPPAVASVAVQGTVRTADGTAIDAVAIAVVGGPANATTDGRGRATLTLDVAAPVVLKLTKAGYADQFVVLRMPATAGADAAFEATMRTRDAELTLADAAAGGTVTGRDGAAVTLPANALVDATGAAVTGPVQIAATPVDPTQPAGGGFPGEFTGVTSEGVATPIVSYGTVEFGLRAGGRALALAPGRTATISIPIYATVNLDRTPVVAGATMPLWSLDEATGTWIQEGEGTVVASSASPSGFALQATVSHFSWWNADNGFSPYGPKPRCVYDTDIGLPPGSINTFATATICNMLAEFDRPSGASSAPGRERAAAVTLTSRIVGYSRRVVLPIAGNVLVPVPAGVDIALNASVLNGTWTGRKVVNGPFAVEAEEIVKLRPTATTGPGIETVTLPFDATRAIDTGQTARFGFSGVRSQFVRITATPGAGSTLTGTAQLYAGTNTLGVVNFGPSSGVLTVRLPQDGAYTVEVVGVTNVPGSYRLRIETLGGTESASLQFPFDTSGTLAAFTTWRGSFTIANPLSALIAFGAQAEPLPRGASARLFAPDGSTLANFSPALLAQNADVRLPGPGAYTLEITTEGGDARSWRYSAEPVQWQRSAPPLAGSNAFALQDFVADRNGAPVLVYTRAFTNGDHESVRIVLARWTGSAWDSAAPDLTIDRPCNAIASDNVAIAFDPGNAPIVAYASLPDVAGADGSYVAARRYAAGAWQPVGPNAGKLPNESTFQGACASPPSLAIQADGTPLVAYRSDNTAYVKRFDGTAWVPPTGTATDAFPAQRATFDLTADPTGRVYFVLAGGFQSGQQTVVRRLSATTPVAWEFVGPNGGVLPQIGTIGLAVPQTRYDSAGRPAIAFSAAVGADNTATGGAAVYRYDGSAWTTTGGYVASAGSFVSNSQVRFALYGDVAYATWTNSSPNVSNVPIVQTNSAAGWRPVGTGLGELPQFTPHGQIVANGYGPRLLATRGELYLVVIEATNAGGGAPPFRFQLLRKVD